MVGFLNVYVGDNVGEFDGDIDGLTEGSNVGIPDLYVGSSVG